MRTAITAGDKKNTGREMEGSAERAAAGSAVVSKAAEAAMCNICFGVIRPGLEIVTCGCKKKYHTSWGDRVGICPTCGASLLVQGTKKGFPEQAEGVREPATDGTHGANDREDPMTMTQK